MLERITTDDGATNYKFSLDNPSLIVLSAAYTEAFNQLINADEDVDEKLRDFTLGLRGRADSGEDASFNVEDPEAMFDVVQEFIDRTKPMTKMLAESSANQFQNIAPAVRDQLGSKAVALVQAMREKYQALDADDFEKEVTQGLAGLQVMGDINEPHDTKTAPADQSG